MATPKKAFDAVKESRKWKLKTGRILAAMTQKERIAFLNRRRDELITKASAKPPRKAA